MERLHVFGLQEKELLRVFGLQLLREIYSFSPWFWSVMEKQPYTFDQWLHLYDVEIRKFHLVSTKNTSLVITFVS